MPERVRLNLKAQHRFEYGTITETLISAHLGTMYYIRLENCPHGTAACLALDGQFRRQPRKRTDPQPQPQP